MKKIMIEFILDLNININQNKWSSILNFDLNINYLPVKST